MKFTNKHNFPPSLVAILSYDDYDYDDRENVLTASQIANSPVHQIILKKQHRNEIEVDVIDRVWSVLGSSTHSLLELVTVEGEEHEQRVYREFGKWIISGKYDVKKLLETNKLEIQDYKNTTKYKIRYGAIPTEWIIQLNTIKWIMTDIDKSLIEKLTIITIIKDLAPKDKFDNTFPSIPIKILNIPVIKNEDIELFIQSKIDAIENYNGKICTPEERWQSETKYSVKKIANKQASYNFDTIEEAQYYIDTHGRVTLWEPIKVIEGEDKRCVGYCEVNNFCVYWKEKYATKSE